MTNKVCVIYRSSLSDNKIGYNRERINDKVIAKSCVAETSEGTLIVSDSKKKSNDIMRLQKKKIINRKKIDVIYLVY